MYIYKNQVLKVQNAKNFKRFIMTVKLIVKVFMFIFGEKGA